MTPEQQRKLLDYFQDICDRLGVGHFELDVKMQPASGEAGTFLLDNEDKAELYVRSDFFEKDVEWQRRLILHEALHVALNRPISALHEVIGGLAPAAYRHSLIEPSDQLAERAIENLARQLARHFPYPEF